MIRPGAATPQATAGGTREAGIYLSAPQTRWIGPQRAADSVLAMEAQRGDGKETYS